MRVTLCGGLVLLAGLAIWQTAPAQSDEKDFSVKGKIQVGNHARKLEAGHLYQVKVDGDGFRPILNLRAGQLYIPPDGTRGDSVEAFFVPRETKSYRFLITPDIYDDELDEGPVDYKFTIREVPLSPSSWMKRANWRPTTRFTNPRSPASRMHPSRPLASN
jgi:hypothetical protein